MPSINPVENFNFGVFGLNEVRTSIVTAVPTAVGVASTTNINNTVFVDVTNWSQESSHGWFGGGYSPGSINYSTVDRIDFSNDSSTASVRGPLSAARSLLAATGNSNYGWFGGGNPGPVSTVDRIDFSNDSSTASVRGPLSLARYNAGATGNSNYGWFAGGSVPGGPITGTRLSRVDRVDYSNDSATASVRGPLSLAKDNLGATSNSNYGWFGGGSINVPIPADLSTVERIDFSNDSSVTLIRGPLSLARYAMATTGNSNYGWFGGGFINPGIVSTVDRIDFSNDSSTSSVRGPLSSGRSFTEAVGNSGNGWFGSGTIPSPFSITTSLERIDFSNDSSGASVRGSLSSARINSAATSGQAKSSSIRPLKGGNFGWFGGGVAGGPVVSIVNRIDFSNDSATASVRGPLSAVRFDAIATGNSNYGWFGGGSPGPRSTVERIDFSNDSSTSSVRGPLSLARSSLSATGNSNYGWFGGGTSPIISTVNRIDFSNDFATASVRGPLGVEKYNLTATGNSNYGWFGGGRNSDFSFSSRVDRIDFSNDSATASVRGPLSSARYSFAATGNSNYGWFGGGTISNLSRVTRVDRIDFSNDSSAASVRGPLSLARSTLAATGNSNYGWFGGGSTPTTPAGFSTVDRIAFSNDSSIASVRGPLSGIRTELSATSNTSIG